MSISSKRVVQAGLVLAALALPGLAAAHGNNGSGDGAAKDSTANDTAALDTATVATAKKHPHGAYLVDSAGWSLYLFKADAKAEGSTCYGACAKAWPPLLAHGKPAVAGMANKDLIGTIERKNGATQVTYNGWPLYYFVKDDEPGDTNGQDVHGFGSEWYLVTPAGKPVPESKHESKKGGR